VLRILSRVAVRTDWAGSPLSTLDTVDASTPAVSAMSTRRGDRRWCREDPAAGPGGCPRAGASPRAGTGPQATPGPQTELPEGPADVPAPGRPRFPDIGATTSEQSGRASAGPWHARHAASRAERPTDAEPPPGDNAGGHCQMTAAPLSRPLRDGGDGVGWRRTGRPAGVCSGMDELAYLLADGLEVGDGPVAEDLGGQ
jgi:hypothetical protein